MYGLVEVRVVGFTGQQRLQTMLLDTGELMPLVKQARETNALIANWQGWCLVVETSTTPRRVVYPIEARA